MNCDQVFQVLTRGPYPTGAAVDASVDEHLAHCESCWRIAEALRPAHDLFQESLSPVESRDLPGYWGDATGAGDANLDLLAPIARKAGVSVTMVGSRPVILTESRVSRLPAVQANTSSTGWLLLWLATGAAMLGGLVSIGLGWPLI